MTKSILASFFVLLVACNDNQINLGNPPSETAAVSVKTYDATEFLEKQDQAVQLSLSEDKTTNHQTNHIGPVMTCGEYNSILYAGQHINTGNVKITNTNTEVKIDVNSLSTQGWFIKAYHVYVGTTAVPTTPSGNPAPGQFPYKDTFNDLQSGFIITIPFSELSLSCESNLYIAIHTEMVKLDENQNEVQTETGWGYGINAFGSGNWGWWIGYEMCCGGGGAGAEVGCTYTQGYWRNHNKYASNENQKIAWPLDEDTMYCNQTWLDILKTPPAGGNAWYILGKQLIAAKLNIAKGASSGAMIDQAINHGEALMIGNCTSIPTEMRQTALDYASILDSYNNGYTGPGHCE
jgi:hypothetical protein